MEALNSSSLLLTCIDVIASLGFPWKHRRSKNSNTLIQLWLRVGASDYLYQSIIFWFAPSPLHRLLFIPLPPLFILPHFLLQSDTAYQGRVAREQARLYDYFKDQARLHKYQSEGQSRGEGLFYSRPQSKNGSKSRNSAARTKIESAEREQSSVWRARESSRV